ncbi:MAG: CoA transferase [Candidatus Dormibacteria bacterium]
MTLPLAGVRVLELFSPGAAIGPRKAVAYAGRLLRGLGAEVTVLEVAPRWADHPILEPWLDAGKLRAAPAAEAPANLVRDSGADLLLLAATPAAAADSGFDLMRAPLPVSVAVSSWGWTGPRSGEQGEELLLDAASGLAWAIGEPGREPLGLPLGVGSFQGGTHAAASALAGLLAPPDASPGWVDLAIADVLAMYAGVNSRIYEPHGTPWARAGRRASGSGGPYPYGLFACADGDVCAIVRSREEWDRFTAMLGDPDWASAERFRDPYRVGRELADEADRLVAPWFAARTCADAVAAAAGRRVALAPVESMESVLTGGNFARDWRGAPDALFPGLPWDLGGEDPQDGGQLNPAHPSRPAGDGRAGLPRLHDPSAAWRPLRGHRVLDLGRVWSGPFVAAFLADLGADVVKIESRTAPDNARLRGRPQRDQAPVPGDPMELVPYFHNLNRGKRSVEVDLRSAAGRRLLLELATSADALVENFAVGVMDRLGLDDRALGAANPHLLHLAMPPVRPDGPLRDLRAYAPIMTSLAGLEGLVGYPGEPATGMMTVGFGDPNAAGHALCALLAGWYGRKRGWPGRSVVTRQVEAVLSILGEATMLVSGGHAVPRRVPESTARIRAHGGDAWSAESATESVRVSRGWPDWDPQLLSRRLTQTVAHPVYGPEEIFRLPWNTGAGRSVPAGPAPLLGQHTGEVVAEWTRPAGRGPD